VAPMLPPEAGEVGVVGLLLLLEVLTGLATGELCGGELGAGADDAADWRH
jgi:hypothetical protein